jgi:hypothetical protein
MPCDDCSAATDGPPLVPSECFRVPVRHPLRRWLPAAAALSLLFHGCLLLTITAIHLPDPEPEARSVFDDLLLEEFEIGAELLINYHLDRIEEVGVPGSVQPDEMVGVNWAADNPPVNMTLPAPPGLPPLHDGFAIVQSPINSPRADGFPVQPLAFRGRSGATRERMLRESGCYTLQRSAEQLPTPQVVRPTAPARRLVARPAVGVSSPYHPMVLEVIPHGPR